MKVSRCHQPVEADAISYGLEQNRPDYLSFVEHAGDAGHSTEPREGAEMFRRALANGQDGQTMKERLDAEERASRAAANGSPTAKM